MMWPLLRNFELLNADIFPCECTLLETMVNVHFLLFVNVFVLKGTV